MRCRGCAAALVTVIAQAGQLVHVLVLRENGIRYDGEAKKEAWTFEIVSFSPGENIGTGLKVADLAFDIPPVLARWTLTNAGRPRPAVVAFERGRDSRRRALKGGNGSNSVICAAMFFKISGYTIN